MFNRNPSILWIDLKWWQKMVILSKRISLHFSKRIWKSNFCYLECRWDFWNDSTLLMHCCFSGLEIIHGTVIYVIIQPIERKSKKSGDMKFFHPFLALILFIFVPKCSCKVNILQHTVDDVKMPKTNFLHTTYFSENIMGNILDFIIELCSHNCQF